MILSSVAALVSYDESSQDISKYGGKIVWVSTEKKFNFPSSIAVCSWESALLIKNPLFTIALG